MIGLLQRPHVNGTKTTNPTRPYLEGKSDFSLAPFPCKTRIKPKPKPSRSILPSASSFRDISSLKITNSKEAQRKRGLHKVIALQVKSMYLEPVLFDYKICILLYKFYSKMFTRVNDFSIVTYLHRYLI